LQAFRAAHPEVIIEDGKFGTLQARIPEPNGEIVITRYRLVELLDKLGELIGEHGIRTGRRFWLNRRGGSPPKEDSCRRFHPVLPPHLPESSPLDRTGRASPAAPRSSGAPEPPFGSRW
jgi:hypothetical protein